MEKDKDDKSRLQKDDPSIIHCTSGLAITKQQHTNRPKPSPPNRRNENHPREKMKPTVSSRPKTVPPPKYISGSQRAVHSHASSPKYANSLPPNFHHHHSPSQSKLQGSYLQSSGAKGSMPQNKNSPLKFHDRPDKKRSQSDAAFGHKIDSSLDNSARGKLAPNFRNPKYQGSKTNQQPEVFQKLLPSDHVGNKGVLKKATKHQEANKTEGFVSQKSFNKVPRNRKGNMDPQTKDPVSTNKTRVPKQNSKSHGKVQAPTHGDRGGYKKTNKMTSSMNKSPSSPVIDDKNSDSQAETSVQRPAKQKADEERPKTVYEFLANKIPSKTPKDDDKPKKENEPEVKNVQQKSLKTQEKAKSSAVTSSTETAATSKYTQLDSGIIGKQILDIVNGKAKLPQNESQAASSVQRPAKQVTDEEKRKLVDDILANTIAATKQNNEKPKKENEPDEHPKQTKNPLSSHDTNESERLVKLGLEQAEERLKKDFIVLLKKKSAHFPNAKFYCKACNYHLDNVPLAHRHIKEKRHRKATKDRQQNEQMRNLIKPPSSAIRAIDDLLQEQVLGGFILDEDDLERRKKVVEKLNRIIQKELPNCSVTLYGSSYSGFGFKTSDVNVDLNHSDEIKSPTALLSVLEVLVHCDAYSRVQPDLCAKVPRINFIDDESSFSMELSTGNEFASYTTRLLRVYALLDPRVIQLSMVLRTWAQMCKLDRQQEGSLPRHAYVLMTIFFMQVHKYLPVLHEMVSEWDMVEILDSPTGCERLEGKGKDLWYFPSVTDEKENKTGLDLREDSDSESELDVSVLSCQEEIIDLTHLSSPDYDAPMNKKSAETPLHTEVAVKPVALCEKCVLGDKNPGELWLELLKFYAIEYPIEEQIIDIRSSTWLSREDKNWGKKRIAIIDPYTSKRNLCRSLNTQGIFTYFMARLRAAVIYFYNSSKRDSKVAKKTVKSKSSPAKKSPTDDVDPRSMSENSTSGVTTDSQSTTPTTGPAKKDSTNEFADRLSDTVLKKVRDHFSDSSVLGRTGSQSSSSGVFPGLDQLADRVVEEVIENLFKTTTSPIQDASGVSSTAERIAREITEEAVKEISSRLSNIRISGSAEESKKALQSEKSCSGQEASSLPDGDEESFVYEFNVSVITNGIFPVKVCSLCKREGHARPNCPDEVKAHKITPLEPLSRQLRDALDRICMDVYEYYVPSKNEVLARDDICSSLMSYLQRTYNKDTTMTLFGSSRNGFGFKESDLDICMTFNGDSTGEGLDFVRIIEDVAKQLRRHPSLCHILPITTAKVPIVKFQHRASPLEGDISLYNLLAQRNSSMLLCYSRIDHRCKMLGYVMKYFVKLCNIGDASRGSLSSYAYTLMVVFYLQQKEVPVLPVLQELYEGKESPSLTIDGWNSWFYDDVKNLPKVWSGLGKNRESVGELWLGLLRFYIEEWDFKRHVICIRQKKLLTTFEKEWTSKCISIEDPFDLNHNLAAGVSLKMTNFIIRVFVKAREHFGTRPKLDIPNEATYFFDPDILMDGEDAPNDRCCKICGKIGHFVRDCPKNKRRRGKEPNNEPNDFRCFVCGEAGHIKRDCPDVNKRDDNNCHSAKSQNLEDSPGKRKPNNGANEETSRSKPSVERSKRSENEKQRNANAKPMKREPAAPGKGRGQGQNQSTSSSDNSMTTTKEPSKADAKIVKPHNPSSSTSSSTPSRNEKPKSSDVKTVPAPSFGIFNDAHFSSPQPDSDPSPTSPSPRYFNFSRNQRNADSAHSQIDYLSRSAPSSHQRPVIEGHSPRLPPYGPDPGVFMTHPQMPHSPQNVMTVGQLESKMLRESPRPLAPPRGNLSAVELKSQQDIQYLAQRSRYGSLPSPASPTSVIPAAPILGMGVTIPQPPFPGFTAPPGIQRTDAQFSGRNFPEQNMTSPLRHQSNTSFGPAGPPYRSYPPGDASSSPR